MTEISHPIQKATSGKKDIFEQIALVFAGIVLLISAIDILPKSDEMYTTAKHIYFAVTLFTALANFFYTFLIKKLKAEKIKDYIFRIIAALDGVLLFLQGFQYILEGEGKVRYIVFLGGILYFLLALYYPKIKRGRMITISEKAIKIRENLLRSKTISRDQVDKIRTDGTVVTIRTKKGREHRVILVENKNLKSFKTELSHLAPE